MTNFQLADGKRLTSIGMHQLVLIGTGITDHWDGDGLNNQRGNLRKVTYKQNAWNRKTRADNLSGTKGVRLKPGSGWQARIMKDGRSQSLGHFRTKEEAAHAYDEAAKKLFGDYARTNQ